MMNILIIEDEQPAARRLKNVLREIDPTIDIIDVKESVLSSVEWFRKNPMPDVVLMDIQLSDGLSFEIFDSVDVSCPVIFTTAFDEYAIKAFKVNSIDYLLKPIETEELRGSLKKLTEIREQFAREYTQEDIRRLLNGIQQQRPVYKSRFLVKNGASFSRINTTEAAYFFSSNKLIYLITWQGRKFLLDYTLEQLEELLDPAVFFRVNRQFLINIDAITHIHPFFSGKLKLQLNPKAEEDVIVSRARAVDFKSWIGE